MEMSFSTQVIKKGWAFLVYYCALKYSGAVGGGGVVCKKDRKKIKQDL